MELLISLLIFGIALIPIFDLFNKSLELTKDTYESVVATNLAAEIIDQLNSMHYSELPLVDETLLDNTANNTLLLQDRPTSRLILSALPDGFWRVVSITQFNPRIKKIAVKIIWGRRPEHEIVLSCLREWSP